VASADPDSSTRDIRLTTDPARLEWTYTLPNSRLAGSSCRQSFSVDANSSTNLKMCFGDLEGALCRPHFSETADLSRWESYFGNNVLRAQYARKGDAELVWNALFWGHCVCWPACNAPNELRKRESASHSGVDFRYGKRTNYDVSSFGIRSFPMFPMRRREV